MKQILCINTHGAGGQDERRIRQLTAGLDAEITIFHIDKTLSYRVSLQDLRKRIREKPWTLIYLEGTGIIGGLNVIYASLRSKQAFIVSSGDPIAGFFRVTKGSAVAAFFEVYERMLYRTSAGFVGWTPYLTGAALQLGAKRAVTVEGGVALDTFLPYSDSQRQELRKQFGLDPTHLICGVVGSLRWTPRQSYCYGLELVEMLKLLKRSDVSLLIVGDGDGRSVLEQRVPPHLRPRVVFTGRLPEMEVVDAINAMDLGFITQTLDGLGNYRLTTKLPEYLACGVPVAMSPVPGFYDYVSKAGWPLPPFHPASSEFHRQCAAWLEPLNRAEVVAKATHARPIAERAFDSDVLSRRFAEFVASLTD